MSSVAKDIDLVNTTYPAAITALPDQKFHLITPNSDLLLTLSFPTSYPLAAPTVVNVQSGTHENLTPGAITNIIAPLYDPASAQSSPPPTLLDVIKVLEANYNDDEVTYDHIQIPPNLPVYTLTPSDLSSELRNAWSSSLALTDRKSTFIAFATRVSNAEELDLKLAILKKDDWIQKATHTSVAYILNGSREAQGFDDDGETAAGPRMLHLLAVSY